MRPETMIGNTRRLKTPCGGIYVTINAEGNEVKEVFSHLGKSGTCGRTFLEALGRVISKAIRAGISKEEIAASLKGMRCGHSDNEEYLSCPHALAVALEQWGGKSS